MLLQLGVISLLSGSRQLDQVCPDWIFRTSLRKKYQSKELVMFTYHFSSRIIGLPDKTDIFIFIFFKDETIMHTIFLEGYCGHQ